jgi:hypothetical protein
MEFMTKIFFLLITFSSAFVAQAETLILESDLNIQGSLESGQSVVRRSSGGENVYFKWGQRVPFAEVIGSSNVSVANQVIYVEFEDVYVWGALTVTLVGDWHAGKTTGIIRKNFAIGRSPGWANQNDGEQLEIALGPIVQRYKIGSASSESGRLRIPIYKIADTRNRVTVFVEGHLSMSDTSANMNAATDISLTEWEVSEEEHIPDEVISFGNPISIGDYVTPANAVPVAGVLRWNGVDFEGYDGDSWLSFTSNSVSGLGETYKLTTPDNTADVVVVDSSGNTTVEGDITVTGTITVATPQGDISMGAFTAE